MTDLSQLPGFLATVPGSASSPPVRPQSGASSFFPECLLLSQRDAQEVLPLWVAFVY